MVGKWGKIDEKWENQARNAPSPAGKAKDMENKKVANQAGYRTLQIENRIAVLVKPRWRFAPRERKRLAWASARERTTRRAADTQERCSWRNTVATANPEAQLPPQRARSVLLRKGGWEHNVVNAN